MKQGILAAGAGALLFFLVTGGLWVTLGRLIPSGTPRSIVLISLAFIFLGVYVWLLISRVREILAGGGELLQHALIAAVEVTAMLVSFAAVYQQIGIIDATGAETEVVNEFWTSLYYSVVTFTTLGYGDFYPQGVGRALAGMQALTGYLVLGLLASVAANVVSPHHPAGEGEEFEDD